MQKTLTSQLLALTGELKQLILSQKGVYYFDTADKAVQFPEKKQSHTAPATLEKVYINKPRIKPVESPVEKEPLPPIQEVKKIIPQETKKEKKDFSSMFAIMEKILPQIKLSREVMSDTDAKETIAKEKMLSKWQADVLIVFSGKEKDLEFIRALAKAIDLELGKVKLCDLEKLSIEDAKILGEKNFSLVIIDPLSGSNPLIRSHYRENPTQGQRFFGISPLFVLHPVEKYHGQAELKKLLWQDLCKHLKKSP